MTSRSRSGSSCSPSPVEPAMSANSTVTRLRSSPAGRGSVTRWPHVGQNVTSAGSCEPQRSHVASAAPQRPQNLAASGFSAPQTAHVLTSQVYGGPLRVHRRRWGRVVEPPYEQVLGVPGEHERPLLRTRTETIIPKKDSRRRRRVGASWSSGGTGRAEAALAASGRGQLVDEDRSHGGELHHDELGDPIALSDLHRLVRGEGYHRAQHLAPVAGVDQAGSVGEGQASSGGQTRAREHETGVAVGDRDGHAGGHEGPLPRLHGDAHRGAEIEAGVPRMPGLGQPPLGPDAGERQVHPTRSISSSRFPDGGRTWARWEPENCSDSITLKPLISTRARIRSRSSTRNAGWAFSAGWKPSSTPRCTSRSPRRNHTPAWSASSGGFGTRLRPRTPS